jgi:thiamine-phosphate pyrophosphorylase
MPMMRVLDANINRAAEGMRVLEDIARFVLENQTVCAAIKQCRHELRAQTPTLLHRDTAGDVGTTVSVEQEKNRNSIRSVAVAAGNRCGEALRVVEEFLKLHNAKNTVEAIRYKMYDLSAEILSLLGGTTAQQWRLCFVMTKDECVLAWQDTLRQSLTAGCDCVQVREKKLSTRELVQHVFEVKKIADKYDAQVIVNDRVDVMLTTQVSGVHLGDKDMRIQDARNLCGPEYIIGATVHAPEKVKTTIMSGADYVGVGAMFQSSTKPSTKVALLGLLKNALPYYHLAIGGITPKNVQTLYETGCKGVAVSSSIAQSTTPGKVVEQLLQHEAQPA